MKNEEKKQSYALWILRRDGEHISVTEGTDYDKIYELYTEVTSKWASSIKENTPFAITSPVVTSFDPGLIYEIKINPVVVETTPRYDNPYNQSVNKNGFSNVFGNVDMLSQVKDNGYR